MDILYERVAGLDVHKDTVVACVRIVMAGKTTRECRTFATTTEQVVVLRAWLEDCRCTQVAMEATGVYWMPVFRILDAGKFELIVANAAHIKNVPGRKTDMNDATWIADLLACGLIHASFVPNEEVQELRALTRTRKQLVREQTRHVQRIDKTLAEANIKLSSVISDIMGASGRRMIQAMIDGVRQPNKLAELAGKQIKATPKELYDALHGRLTDHHRFLLALHLKQWDNIDEMIRKLDIEIDQRIVEPRHDDDRHLGVIGARLHHQVQAVEGAQPHVGNEQVEWADSKQPLAGVEGRGTGDVVPRLAEQLHDPRQRVFVVFENDDAIR